PRSIALPRRPGYLQQPAAPLATPLPRRPHRRHPLPAVLGRSAGAGRRTQNAGFTAPLPHPASRGRGRSRTLVPTVEGRGQSGSEEFHGREVVRGRTPGLPFPIWVGCAAAADGGGVSGEMSGLGRSVVS